MIYFRTLSFHFSRINKFLNIIFHITNRKVPFSSEFFNSVIVINSETIYTVFKIIQQFVLTYGVIHIVFR